MNPVLKMKAGVTMEFGQLYHEGDKTSSLEEQVEAVLKKYKAKFGRSPVAIALRANGSVRPETIAGIPVQYHDNVTPRHIWLEHAKDVGARRIPTDPGLTFSWE